MQKTDTSYNPWETGGLPLLNIAATCPVTEAHGPGVRTAVWVQGCPFKCQGCISPAWIPYRIETLICPDDLAKQILEHAEIDGITVSGGEPMLQASGLAQFIQTLRQQRELSVICFTGFVLERLRKEPPSKGVEALLAQVDVLIDGPYIAEKNDNKGFRGSNNQRVHYLTDRISTDEYDFENSQRRVEIHIRNGEALLVGVPPEGVLQSFDGAIAQAIQQHLTQEK